MNFRQLLALIFAVVLSGCQSSAPSIDRKAAVTIVKKPAFLQNGSFVEYANKQSAKGVTEWFFHCYTNFEYHIDETREVAPKQIHIAITITKLTMTISLPITLRLGQFADDHLVEHEKGHAKIAMRVYDTAQDQARAAAESIIGTRFEGEGTTTEEAAANAVDQAARAVCQKYRLKTVEVANKVSELYDQVTKHGNKKIPQEEAINESYDRYNKALLNGK